MMEWKRLLGHKRSVGDKTGEKDPLRSPFETDYDRIIFSHPFRRLQDKTQVHPLPVHDFVHTRLSHSLEVSSVGRSLGKSVGSEILKRHIDLGTSFSFHEFGDIVAAASLAHDIGNPPFGHSGEQAISDFFKYHPLGQKVIAKLTPEQSTDLINFEGNAQGFRILNQRSYHGLSLTFATLAAFTKYPRPSYAQKDKRRKSHKKYGYFQAEKEIFREMAQELGLSTAQVGEESWNRHPLAFLVEAADDICYGIIDLEDGCRLGLLSYSETESLLAPIIGERFNREKINRYRTQEEKIGLLRAMAIGKLVEETRISFLDNENDILFGKFDSALTDVIPSTPYLNEIGKVSLEKIYRSRKVVETEAVGFEVLPGLMEAFVGAIYQKFDDQSRLSGREKAILRLIPLEFITVGDEDDLYRKVLCTTDFIASLTDSAALSLFRNIKGIELPKG